MTTSLIDVFTNAPEALQYVTAGVALAIAFWVSFFLITPLGMWWSYAVCTEYKGNFIARLLIVLIGGKYYRFGSVGCANELYRVLYKDSEGETRDSENLIMITGFILIAVPFVLYLAITFWEIVSIALILFSLTKLSRFSVQLSRKLKSHTDNKEMHND